MADKRVQLFTDGACRGNPGPGGWGVLLRYDGRERELYGGETQTTNNRMELLAVIVALEALNRDGLEVHVWSDSRYVVDAVEKGWVFGWEKKGFKAKKNPDLWQRFLRAYRRHRVRLHWIKGHNDHPLNERCDRLAVAASQSPEHVDEAYERGMAG